MKKVIVAIALTLTAVGCGASDGTENTAEGESGLALPDRPPPVVPLHCPAGCAAAGGTCFLDSCVPGCENAPLSCTATVSTPLIAGYGYLSIACTGIGNGVYTVQLTAAPEVQGSPFGLSTPPDGPWTLWTNGSTEPDTGGFVIDNGGPIVFEPEAGSTAGLDEQNMFFKGCHQDAEGNWVGCSIAATFVQVCALPGVDGFTEQSGLCDQTPIGENFAPPACVEVQVTAAP